MTDRRPDVLKQPPAVPREHIDRCLAAVEIALARGNREECDAALDRAFRVELPERVTLDSPIASLELDMRILNLLEDGSILTVSDLCRTSARTIQRFPNVGR